MKVHPASHTAVIVAASGLKSANMPPISEMTPSSASQIQEDLSF